MGGRRQRALKRRGKEVGASLNPIGFFKDEARHIGRLPNGQTERDDT